MSQVSLDIDDRPNRNSPKRTFQSLVLSDIAAHLPRITLGRIKAVSQRIRRVVLIRAAIIAWLLFAALLLIGISLDRLVLLDAGTRWAIAAVLHLSTIAAFIVSYLRRASLAQSPEWLARVIESRSPALKNRLLSSIELASLDLLGKSGAAGSHEFIEQLQTDVAARIETVAPKHILRWKSIRGWIIGGTVCALLFCGALFVPRLSFAKRAARVIYPGINFGRITNFEIELVAPRQPWVEVRNDLFMVRAVAVAGKPQALRLEVDDYEQVSQVAMIQSERDPNEFIQNVSLSSAKARVRAYTEDSYSSWYDIQLVDRPKIDPVRMEVTAPEYAKLPQTLVDNWDGDVRVVEGTRVTMHFAADAPLSQAELNLEKSNAVWRRATPRDDSPNKLNIPLQLRGDSQWEADMLVDFSGEYSLAAIDRRTQKSSDTTRRFRITAEQDSPPKLRWQLSDAATAQNISSETLLPVTIEYADEFPLHSLVFQWRKDRSEWNSVTAELQEESTGTSTWILDPLSMNAKESELIEVRVLAQDRKEQTSNSPTVQFLVSESYVSADRWDRMVQRLAFVGKTSDWTGRWKSWFEGAEKMSQEDKEKALTQWSNVPLEHAVLKEARKSLLPIIYSSDDVVEAESLLSLANRLNSLCEFEIPRHLDLVSEVEKLENLDERVNRIRDSARSLQQAFESLDRAGRMLLGEDVMIAASQDMHSIISSQSALQASLQTLPAEQVQNRQAAIGGIVGKLLDRLAKFSVAFDEGERVSLQSHLRNLKQVHASILLTTGKGVLQNKSYWQSEESRRWIEQNNQRFKEYRDMDTYLGRFASEHRNSRRISHEWYSPWVKELDSMRSLIGNLRGDSDLNHTIGSLARLKALNKNMDQYLLDTREVELAKQQIDRFYVSDLGNARLALQNIWSTAKGDKDEFLKSLDEVGNASKVLDAAHNNALFKSLIDRMISLEASPQTLHSMLVGTQPRNMEEYNYLMDRLRESMEIEAFPQGIRQLAHELSWGASQQVVGQAINSRRWQRESLNRMSGGLMGLNATRETMRNEMEPAVIAARATIAKYIPSISELAKKAADQVKSANEMARQPELDNAEQKNAQEQAKQDVDKLQQGLEDLANTRDLLSKEQADIARDADAALKAIADAVKQAEAALQSASQEAEEQSSTQVQQAQENLEKVLEQIGEHFEQVEQAQQSQQQSPAGALSEKMTAQSESDAQEEAYEEAEFLRDVANMSPEDILHQLEATLPDRPKMQTELQSIAANTLLQSQANVDTVASKQKELQRELEQSDSLLNAQKQVAVQKMQQLAREMNKLTDQEMSWMQQATARAQLQEPQDQINQVRDEIRAVQQEIYEISTDAPLEQIAQRAAEVTEKLNKVGEKFKLGKEQVDAIQDRAPTQDERQLNNLQREAGDWQRRFQRDTENWLRGETHHRENEAKNLERNLQNSRENLQRAEEQLQRRQQDYDNSQKEPWRLDQVQAAQRNVQQGKRNTQAAEIRSQAANEMLERANQLSQQLSQPPQELTDQDRHLELAKEIGDTAAKSFDQIREQVQALQDSLAQMNPPQPARSAADGVAQKEQALQEGLQRTAGDYARASRHAERLGEQNEAQELQKLSHASEKVASDAMQQTIDQLRNGMEKTDAAESQLPAETGEAVQNQLAKSTDQLGQIAERSSAATESIAQAQPNPPRSQNTPPSPPGPSFSDFMNDTELAELLDDLDRVVHNTDRPAETQAESSSTESSQSGQSSNNSSNSSQSSSSSSNGKRQSSTQEQQGREAVQAPADKLADMLAQKRNRSKPNQAGKQASKGQQQNGKSQQMSNSNAPAAGDVESKWPAGGDVEVPEQSSGSEAFRTDWARLRENQMEDISTGQRASSDSPHQDSIDAYFRAISKLRIQP